MYSQWGRQEKGTGEGKKDKVSKFMSLLACRICILFLPHLSQTWSPVHSIEKIFKVICISINNAGRKFI